VIRLLTADDHPVVRDGLRGMVASEPDLEVVGEAGNGLEALALVPRVRPDVALVDLRMPTLDGVGTIRALRERHPELRVLVLTTFDTERDLVSAIEAGATGFLLKDAPRAELFRAVRAAARGETVLAPEVATRLGGRLAEPVSPAGPPSPSPSASCRCWSWWPGGPPTARSRPASRSARPRSRPTWSTPSASWA
jgi:DNA-binding NarL/FixJ family response regulator